MYRRRPSVGKEEVPAGQAIVRGIPPVYNGFAIRHFSQESAFRSPGSAGRHCGLCPLAPDP